MGSLCGKCRRGAKHEFELLTFEDPLLALTSHDNFLLRGIWKTVTNEGNNAQVGIILFKKFFEERPDMVYPWIHAKKFIKPDEADNWVKDPGFLEYIRRFVADLQLFIWYASKQGRLVRRLDNIREIHRYMTTITPDDYECFAKCLFDAVVEQHGGMTSEEAMAFRKFVSLLYIKVVPDNVEEVSENSVTLEFNRRRRLVRKLQQDKLTVGIDSTKYKIQANENKKKTATKNATLRTTIQQMFCGKTQADSGAL